MKYIFDWKEYANTARKAVAEGCVLLRNEGNALPIKNGETVSVFGRNLKMEDLSIENGSILLTGRIDKIEFSEIKEKHSFFKDLFR